MDTQFDARSCGKRMKERSIAIGRALPHDRRSSAGPASVAEPGGTRISAAHLFLSFALVDILVERPAHLSLAATGERCLNL